MEFITIVILIFLFFALYFFFIFLLLHLKNKNRLFEIPIPKKNYGLTVLVPAYNEEDSIEKTLLAILSTDYAGFKKVIAINDGSKDNTLKIMNRMAKKDKRIFVLDKPNSGKADSLNHALKHVNTELFAVVDADSYPEKDAFRNIVGFFNDPKMGAVSSAILSRQNKTLIQKVQNFEYDIIVWTRKLLDFVDGVFVAPGALSVYRAKPVQEFGGFDKNNITEDIEVTWHLLHEGYKTGMALSARSYTEVPNKWKALWNQRVRWGMGGIQTLIKYRKDFIRKSSLGLLIYPFVASTILLSYISVFFMIFLFLKGLIKNIFIIKYSLQTSTLMYNILTFEFNPNVLIFFAVCMFILSLWFFLLGLRLIDSEELRKRNFFNMAFYLLIYSVNYPIVWLGALFKLLRRNSKW